MGCSEIEFKGWSCCCMAKSKETCKCFEKTKQIKIALPPPLFEKDKLKYIKLNSD